MQAGQCVDDSITAAGVPGDPDPMLRLVLEKVPSEGS